MSKHCPFFHVENGGNSLCKQNCALYTPKGCAFVAVAEEMAESNFYKKMSNLESQTKQLGHST